MGNRRLGRARLYTIEKSGATLDLSPDVDIRDAIARTTQHRVGQEIITEIVVDLGTSKATVIGGNGAEKAVGVSGKAASLGQMTRAKVGIVTEVRAVVTEAPDSEGDVNNTLDIWFHTAGITQGAAVGGGTAGPADINAAGEDTTATYDANQLEDKYLYIANATGVSGNVQFTAGKLVIYIYGFAVPDDL